MKQTIHLIDVDAMELMLQFEKDKYESYGFKKGVVVGMISGFLIWTISAIAISVMIGGWII